MNVPEKHRAIKPKPKVKKWRWVFADLSAFGAPLRVTQEHFPDEATVERNRHWHSVKAIQKIDSTMIEVD